MAFCSNIKLRIGLTYKGCLQCEPLVKLKIETFIPVADGFEKKELSNKLQLWQNLEPFPTNNNASYMY